MEGGGEEANRASRPTLLPWALARVARRGQFRRMTTALEWRAPSGVPSSSMNSAEEQGGPVRALLRLPDFLRLWLVGAFANAMRWLELLASGLFAYEVTGSAPAVTLVGAGRHPPHPAFRPLLRPAPHAVDRHSRVILALARPA